MFGNQLNRPRLQIIRSIASRPRALLLAGLLGLAGCGYTLSGSTLPSRFQSIHVTNFKNDIAFATSQGRNVYFPLIEVDARTAVIDRFILDGNLKITNEDRADLLLEGALVNYRRSGLRFSEEDDAEEYRVFVDLQITVHDQQKDEIFWSGRISGTATYFEIGPQATSEQSAVDEAIDDLARRVVERIVEHW